ncbi:MAG: hypothetical protein L3J39_18995 [Verrucomicrobiales bacterium]|nr:hypothetical protein [Verrucomicrobiales bacterium]
MPDEQFVIDAGGIPRHKIRVKWWTAVEGVTYRSVVFPEQEGLPDTEVSSIESSEAWDIYPADAVPVFVGHYWLPPQTPEPFQNVVCLDYSVAKDDFLTAYRWNPSSQLSRESFVTTEANA